MSSDAAVGSIENSAYPSASPGARGAPDRAATVARGRILVVDGDGAMRTSVAAALEAAGFRVDVPLTGDKAIQTAKRAYFDVAVIELTLRDMSGLQVARVVRDLNAVGRFIVTGSAPTVQASVQAMKLGAVDVLEKPVEAGKIVDLIRACLTEGVTKAGTPPASQLTPIRVSRGRPGCVAERWAFQVLQASRSDDDLKTLREWARCVGVSYSTLCESCRIVGIKPHVARDFMRALRAVIKGSLHGCDPSVLLDVSNRRTLEGLIEKGGPRFDGRGKHAVAQFLLHQRFSPVDKEGIRVLISHFERMESDSDTFCR